MLTLEQRREEDFRFLVMTHAVGDPGLYALLRDRSLDNPKPPTPQELGEREYLSWFNQGE